MPVDPSLILGGAFVVAVTLALAADLGIAHRDAHTVSSREALRWTALWVSLALLFGVALLAVRGVDTAVAYLTGYVIEYSLSVDNVFVFGLVFTAFAVPRELQHRVLFWGVVGALVMRLVMIVAGAAVIERATWILYLFGAFLILTGIRMLRQDGESPPDPNGNLLVRLARRRLRVADGFVGQRFVVATDAGRAVTPLFLALLAVEASDLIFAVDSIPAIFAVTTDPFVVFTSNAFAILGLRSLYFLLADAAARFRYLRVGLAAVLLFVGAKLVLADLVHLHPVASLAVIVGLLAVAVAASLRADAADRRRPVPVRAEDRA